MTQDRGLFGTGTTCNLRSQERYMTLRNGYLEAVSGFMWETHDDRGITRHNPTLEV